MTMGLFAGKKGKAKQEAWDFFFLSLTCLSPGCEEMCSEMPLKVWELVLFYPLWHNTFNKNILYMPLKPLTVRYIYFYNWYCDKSPSI